MSRKLSWWGREIRAYRELQKYLLTQGKKAEHSPVWEVISELERAKKRRDPNWARRTTLLLRQSSSRELRTYAILSLQAAIDAQATPEARFETLLNALRSKDQRVQSFLVSLYLRHQLKYLPAVEVLRVADQLEGGSFRWGLRGSRVLIRMLVLAGDSERALRLYHSQNTWHDMNRGKISLAFAGGRALDLTQQHLAASRKDLFFLGVTRGSFPRNGLVHRYESALADGESQWEPVFHHQSENDPVLMKLGASIAQGQAFSFVRLGEGEGYLLGLEDSYRLYFERHWWGTELSAPARTDLVARGRQAIDSADLLGTPSQFRLHLSSNSKSAHYAGLAHVMRYFVADSGAGRATTNTEYFWLANKEKFKGALVQRAKKIVIVTDKAAELVKSFPLFCGFIGPIVVLNIPSHAQNADNPRTMNVGAESPANIMRLDASLASHCGPGVLVMVSAGVAGKYLCHIAKQNGAVGVDVGAALHPLGQMIEGWGL